MTREELNKAKQQMAEVGALSPLQVKALIAEAEQARKDTERLDWCIKNTCGPVKRSDGLWNVFLPDEDGDYRQVGEGDSPRSAIDAARGAK